MRIHRAIGSFLLFSAAFVCVQPTLAAEPPAQSLTSAAGTVQGTVTDPTGAVIPNATITLSNPITGYKNSATTDANGQFTIRPVPLNHYHVSATAPGFSPTTTDVDVRSTMPLKLPLTMNIASAQTTITVEGGSEDLVETTPISHTDIGEQLMERLPVQNVGSAHQFDRAAGYRATRTSSAPIRC
ncbi:MAG TPA: carboxypeptidase-like regulatory domain-containing protein [Terriglobales bacterium]|nr:carboxypeptidase-like regulatory domain-containing protein [Terriglobales bacterium]